MKLENRLNKMQRKLWRGRKQPLNLKLRKRQKIEQLPKPRLTESKKNIKQTKPEGKQQPKLRLKQLQRPSLQPKKPMKKLKLREKNKQNVKRLTLQQNLLEGENNSRPNMSMSGWLGPQESH